jgi:hypothetical protein
VSDSGDNRRLRWGSFGRNAELRCVLLTGLFACFLNLASGTPAWSQAPPPSPPPRARPAPPRLDANSVSEHLRAVRRRLEQAKSTNSDTGKLLAMARRALDVADERAKAKDFFGAERRIAGADDLIHASEHPLHIAEGPKGPLPQAREVADHLQDVYFRLQQADYFATTSGEPDAQPLPSIARKFYEQAREAYDTGDWFVAEEYTKSAADTVRALENLAQAAAPEPARPPKPIE